MSLLHQYGAGERRFAEAGFYPEFVLARVTAQYRGVYRIVTENGEKLAEVAGRFRFEAKGLVDYPAVGDFVMVDGGEDGHAVIHHLLRRQSSFERTVAGGGVETQVVAANIDLVFLCMSLNNDYNLSRLERYLVVAWSSGATPVVVLTKSDLCENTAIPLRDAAAVAPGVDVVLTSSLDDSVQTIEEYLKPGVTASFIGSSGVGKSTLINRLAGGELFETAEIRKDGKGKHTTTHRELVLLPNGGLVIDTPGMRELGVETVDLSQTFSDVERLSASCRFRDCTHTKEPGCAVLAAIEAGELDARRLENYRKLGREAKYDGLTARQIDETKINAMFGGKTAMKKMMDGVREKNKRR